MIHAPQTPCFAGIMTALPRKPMTRASRPPEDDGGTATVAEEAAPTITILGGSPDSGNLGVSALGICAAKGALLAFPRAKIILQSWLRDDTVEIFIGNRALSVETMMVYYSGRVLARQGTRHLELIGRWADRLPRPLGTALTMTNRTLAQFLTSDAVLDVSGGDSFAEIYGDRTFRAQIALKRLALALGKPLFLLPQTYGPFHSSYALHAFREIVEGADLVATREAGGIEELIQWCGEPVSDRAVCTPDMAFMLDPVPVAPEREPAATRGGDDRPLIGVNISGLLYLSDADFGLQASYPDLVDGMLRTLLDFPDTRLLLVPHVVPREHLQSGRPGPARDHADQEALQTARNRLPRSWQDRVTCVGGPYTAGETKYLIGQCDFFVGARMHACIAGVSQCIPTATVAYSKKASQLMANLGIGNTVIDPRTHGLDACVASLREMFQRRSDIRARLEQIMPPVKEKIESFFRNTIREAVSRRCNVAHR